MLRPPPEGPTIPPVPGESNERQRGRADCRTAARGIGAVMDVELAQPIYLGFLGRLRAMRAGGSQHEAVLAEIWEPVALNHRPTGELTGLPCASCSDPWP